MYRDGRSVDVLFFVEHRDRELEVVSAVAKILRDRHGLSVAIASAIFHPILSALVIRPRVVVSTGIAPAKSETQGPEFIHAIFQSVYGESITYACMNWEQILSPINKSFRPPRDPFTRTQVHHMSWGTAYRQFLISSGVRPENIGITGKPSLSLLERKVRFQSQTLKHRLAARSGLPKHARWIFFPMTCHLAFFSEYHVRSRIGLGSDELTVLEHAAYVRRTINEIFTWLGRLDAAIDSEQVVIVLRPHPAIAVAQYEDRFAEVVGRVPRCVRITKEGTAHEWLAACESCYTNYSSLALDATAVGRPACLLEPEPYPWFLKVDWFEGLPRVQTFETLVDSLAGTHLPSRVPTEALARHAEAQMDGIERTAERLFRLARAGTRGTWSAAGLAKVFTGVHRRRAVGSLIRMGAASTHLWRFVRPGLQPDFFGGQDVVRLWSEGELTPNSPQA